MFHPAPSCVVCLFLLASCGGSETSGTGTSLIQTDPVPYEGFNSGAASTSELAGVAIVVRGGDDGAVLPQRVSGSLTHNTGRTVLHDGIYRLADPNGADGSGNLADGTASARLMTVGSGANGAYRYGRIYTAAYNIEGTDFVAGGVVGIPTRAADIPGTGNATFRGFGEIGAVYAPGIIGTRSATFNEEGTSKIDVDFATGKVNAEISLDGSANPLMPVDRISARGMALSGNRFGAGTVRIFNDGARVYPNASISRAASEGVFYGAKRDGDGNLTPAEVGGSMIEIGESAVVFGVYLGK